MNEESLWLDPAIDLDKLTATIEREGYELVSKTERDLDHACADHGTILVWKAPDRGDVEVQVSRAWGMRHLAVVYIHFESCDPSLHRLIRQSFDQMPTRASAAMIIEGQLLAKTAEETSKARLGEISELHPYILHAHEIIDTDPECDVAYQAFDSWRRTNCDAVEELTPTLNDIGAFRVWFK